MTALAANVTQGADRELDASQTMNAKKFWQVTPMQEDALLFTAPADGTVKMRAVTQVEWNAVLAANEVSEPRRKVADVVRDIVAAETLQLPHGPRRP